MAFELVAGTGRFTLSAPSVSLYRRPRCSLRECSEGNGTHSVFSLSQSFSDLVQHRVSSVCQLRLKWLRPVRTCPPLVDPRASSSLLRLYTALGYALLNPTRSYVPSQPVPWSGRRLGTSAHRTGQVKTGQARLFGARGDNQNLGTQVGLRPSVHFAARISQTVSRMGRHCVTRFRLLCVRCASNFFPLRFLRKALPTSSQNFRQMYASLCCHPISELTDGYRLTGFLGTRQRYE